MSNIAEQVSAGALLVVSMAGLVALAIGLVACCDRFSSIRRIPKAQRNLVNAWRLQMIAKGRATWKTAPLLVPSQQELDAMIAEIAEEAQQSASRNARETGSLVQAMPGPEAERPEILRERQGHNPPSYAHVGTSLDNGANVPDCKELDILLMSNSGLSEEDFRDAYCVHKNASGIRRIRFHSANSSSGKIAVKSIDKPGFFEELDGHVATAASNGVMHAESVCPRATTEQRSPM